MRRALLVRSALALGVFLAVDQLVQFGLLADGYLGRVRIAPFDPPLFSPYQWERLEALERLAARGVAPEQFDGDLGWCPRPGEGGDGFQYDARGGRATSVPPTGGAPALVVVGCSFTRGDEVAADEAWPALLARAWSVDVVNLGVGGYGTDQAYLRFVRDGLTLEPAEAWLGIVPGTCLRLSTHFAPLERHWAETVAFKPRFLVGEDGSAELVPSPVADVPGYLRLLHDQRALLAAIGRSDLWIRRSPSAYAPRGTRWSHRLAVGRLALTWLERGDRAPEPWLEGESEVRRALEWVVVAFVRECRAHGIVPRILVLPSREDLRSRRHHGAAYWDGVFGSLAAHDIDVLDLTQALEAAGVVDDPGGWRPGGHYAPSTHRVVAGAIEATWTAPGGAEEPQAR